MLPAIETRRGTDAAAPEEQERLGALRQLVAQGSQRAQERLAAIDRLAHAAGEFARPQYDFLFDETRHLLAIGYNVGERRRDDSFYDLLASEARLASFVAIAQGQLPQEHLVRPGPTAHRQRRRADAPFLERLDVRVPDAAPGHAHL